MVLLFVEILANVKWVCCQFHYKQRHKYSLIIIITTRTPFCFNYHLTQAFSWKKSMLFLSMFLVRFFFKFFIDLKLGSICRPIGYSKLLLSFQSYPRVKPSLLLRSQLPNIIFSEQPRQAINYWVDFRRGASFVYLMQPTKRESHLKSMLPNFISLILELLNHFSPAKLLKCLCQQQTPYYCIFHSSSSHFNVNVSI